MTISRRQFIAQIARSGGYGAAFMTMHSLGLLGMTETTQREDFPLPRSTGRGTKVIILGAGIAGLVSAYEMRRAGFECTLLEAQRRPGGRNWTLRGGTKVDLTDGTSQECAFDKGNYLNAGPARLPSIHKTMLGYCRELGVALEVELNTSRRALLQNDDVFDGKPVRRGQAINDTRGYLSELLAKCVQQGALDQAFTGDDHALVMDFLRSYGDLSQDYRYSGSSRSGDLQEPGAAGQIEIPCAPLPFSGLLRSRFCQPMMFEEMLDQQATMFQPVGGMDRIPYAFARELRQIIHYSSPVKEIRKTSDGVRVLYRHGESGPVRSIEAAYCICAMPLSVLNTVPNDFSPRVRSALQQIVYDDAYKIAWESRRFWEQDGDEIHGGISWLTSGPITLVWYPSENPMSQRGVIIGGYSVERRSEFAALPSREAKLAASKAAIERLHPGKSGLLEKPIYLPWSKVPYLLGSWVGGGFGRSPEGSPYHNGPYREFIVPDDRIYFAGDHCSHIVGWQEGAALSAQRAVAIIAGRVQESSPASS